MQSKNMLMNNKKRGITMKKLKKEWFDNVIVFSFSEPGAMGPNNMRFTSVMENGLMWIICQKKRHILW